MLRVPLDRAYIDRSIRPIYAFTQATAQSRYLDDAYDRETDPAIYPGMVAMAGSTGDTVDLIDATGVPLGLFGLYVGGEGIDELRDAGINAMPVWVLGPDAEFEIDRPAFDDDETWTVSANGTTTFVYAKTSGADRGKLVPAGASNRTTAPVARLIKVINESTIVIGGLLSGTGTPGPTGATGATGPAGPTGPTGPAGA